MDYQRNGWFRPTCGVSRQASQPRTPEYRREHAVHAEACAALSDLSPTSLAMVYSPMQSFTKLYEPAKALSRGTLFAELDKPFTGKC